MDGSPHPPAEKQNTRLIVALAVLTVALFVFCITYFARVSNAGSDPKFTLLVSQSILENGTLRLDTYVDRANLSGQEYQLLRHNGHLYYYFPVGTSVIMLPIVWFANRAGVDFANAGSDAAWQNLLSAITCSLIFVLLFWVARTLLSDALSLLVASVTMLGSGLVSTLGTALWSQNLATLFALVSILLLLRRREWSSKARWSPYALGVLLFAAFACRPTAAAYVGITLVFLLISDPAYFARTAAIALLLMCGWLAFSYLEFGQVLPPYYSMSRLRPASSPMLPAIYGQLISPSRGIFVFSPFLLLVVGAVLFGFSSYRRQPLVYYGLTWFVIHLVVVSVGHSVPWWGGHSFGPRLLVDAVPALFLLSVVLFRSVSDDSYGRRRTRAALLVYLTLGGLGFLINTVQGLYNGDTARWNGALLPPDPGNHNSYLFSWRYPQFAATKGALCKRNREFMESRLSTVGSNLRRYELGESIGYQADEQQAIFVGWSRPQGGWRWTECAGVEVVFGPVELGDSRTLALELWMSTETVQTITVSMNDVVVGHIDIREPGTQPERFRISLDGSLVHQTGLNRLGLHVPEVATLVGDAHLLGLRFTELKLAATSAGSTAPPSRYPALTLARPAGTE